MCVALRRPGASRCACPRDIPVLFLWAPVCRSVYLDVCVSVCLSVCLSLSLSLSLSVRQAVVCLFVCFSLTPSRSLARSLSRFLSTCIRTHPYPPPTTHPQVPLLDAVTPEGISERFGTLVSAPTDELLAAGEKLLWDLVVALYLYKRPRRARGMLVRDLLAARLPRVVYVWGYALHAHVSMHACVGAYQRACIHESMYHMQKKNRSRTSCLRTDLASQ